jgi:hypothetical protein
VPPGQQQAVKTYLICQSAVSGSMSGPSSSGFALSISSNQLSVTASWNAPSAGVTTIQVWTSSDNVTFSLEVTVAAPGTSTPLTAPALGSTKYAKIKWCSGANCGAFSNTLSVFADPVLNWSARVQTNGGAAPANSTITAMQTFYQSLITANLWSRIYHMNVIAPDNIIAMRTPLIVGIGFDPWVRHTIGAPGAGADTLTNFGWQGYSDVNNGYVYDTGVKPSLVSAFTTGNAGMVVYSQNPNANGNMMAGCYTAGTIDPQYGIVPWQNGTNAAYYYSYTTARVINVGLGPSQAAHSGFWLGSLSSTTRADLYFANSITAWASIGNNTTTHTEAVPSDSTVSFGGSHQGATYNLLNSAASFLVICDGFSSADGQSLYNAVQALRVAFGSGFS